MGRKGTSKRKPKKLKPASNANVSGNSPVQALIKEKDKSAPAQNDGAKASGGWNKKKKKR
jgi:hypothetical protein